MKEKLIIAGIVLGFLLVVFAEARHIYSRSLREIDRLKTELAKAQKNDAWKTDTIRDSIVVYSQDVEILKQQAYKKELADKKLIKELKMKISRMESEQTVGLVTHDTVYLHEATDSTLEYKDKWVQFRYSVPTKQLGYAVKDSIATYVERIPKHRFLWWQWGVKSYKVKVVNFNPHSTIVHNEYYKVGK